MPVVPADWKLPMKRVVFTLLVSAAGFVAIVSLGSPGAWTAEAPQVSVCQTREARSADPWTFNR